MLKPQKAEDVAEDLLCKTGTAIETGDFEVFGDCFAVPCVVETMNTLKVISKPSGIRETFDNVRRYYREHDVTTVARNVVKAEFLTRTTIGSTHVTSLLTSRGDAFGRPFPTYSVLRRYHSTSWKIISCTYAILDAQGHNEVLMQSRSELGDDFAAIERTARRQE